MRPFALAIAAALLLGSCANEPEPIEPMESPSPPASPTPPPLPKKARENTPSGAATFVDYWVSAFNYAARTGDVGPMRRAAENCSPCNGYADRFRSLKRAERPEGPAWTLIDVRVGPSRDPIEVVTKVRVLEERKTYALTFVLNSGAPFELKDIYDRGKS
jgi:hypothetical protein